MTREVVRPEICLGLDDHAGAFAVYQRAADELLRDGDDVTRVPGCIEPRRFQRIESRHGEGGGGPSRCARSVPSSTEVTLPSACNASSSSFVTCWYCSGGRTPCSRRN